MTDLAGPVNFEVVDLALAALPGAPPAESLEFEQQVAQLQRAVLGAVKVTKDVENRLAHLRQAILDTPNASEADLTTARTLQTELDDIKIALVGDPTKGGRNVNTPPSISDRVGRIVGGLWTTTQGPTQTQRDTYAWAGEAFATELGRLQSLVADLEAFEAKLETAGAPWTPGRVPTWQAE
jgi:exonuclease VII small subunit